MRASNTIIIKPYDYIVSKPVSVNRMTYSLLEWSEHRYRFTKNDEHIANKKLIKFSCVLGAAVAFLITKFGIH